MQNNKFSTNSKAQDYSHSRQKFRLSAYYAPTDGTWYDAGKFYRVDEDFRTVKRYKEYLDAGLNVMLLSGSESCKYRGEEWDSSDTKMMMDRAFEAGISEILIFDYRLREEMSAVEGGLVGEGKMFGSEQELDYRVEECMRPYMKHPAFCGVILRDEPNYKMLKSIGQVYRSIKRVYPSAVVHCNLWPPAYSSIGTFLPPVGEPKDLDKSWKTYLSNFVDFCGASYIQYDQYPFQPGFIAQGYLKGLQMSAEFCRDREIDFYYTAQTFGMIMNGKIHHRPVTEEDVCFLLNNLLGFGVKEIAYYSYWTFQNCMSDTTYVLDGTSFITRDGRKTDMYYFMQRVNRDLQKFAPVILDFTYQASTYYTKDKTKYFNGHVADHEFYKMKREKLTHIKNVEFDKETILMTELKDMDKGHHMYMVQNIIDPAEKDGENTAITIKVEFDDKFEHVVVYEKGVPEYIKLDLASYQCTLHPGQAKFLLPY